MIIKHGYYIHYYELNCANKINLCQGITFQLLFKLTSIILPFKYPRESILLTTRWQQLRAAASDWLEWYQRGVSLVKLMVSFHLDRAQSCHPRTMKNVHFKWHYKQREIGNFVYLWNLYCVAWCGWSWQQQDITFQIDMGWAEIASDTDECHYTYLQFRQSHK